MASTGERQPDRVVLFGAPPTSPETECGWIEPGSPMAGHDGLAWTVRPTRPSP